MSASRKDIVSKKESLKKAHEYWTPERMAAAEPVIDYIPKRDEAPPAVPQGPGNDPAAGSTSAIVPRPYINDLRSKLTGRLFFNRSGKDLVGTAFVLMPSDGDITQKSLVVTCAHCLIEPLSGAWSNRILFVPAYNNEGAGGDDRPFGKWLAWEAWVPQQYIEQKKLNGVFGESAKSLDIAIIDLVHFDKTLIQTLGGGLTPLYSMMNRPGTEPGTASTDREHGPSVTCYGYPGSVGKFSGFDMWSYTGKGHFAKDHGAPGWQCWQINYVQTAGGFSGSPIFSKDEKGNLVVVGVHNAGTDSPQGPAYGAPFYDKVFGAIEKKAVAGKDGINVSTWT